VSGHDGAVPRTILVVLIATVAALTTACRLDVTVEVLMDDTGGGTVTVTALADAELVRAAPDLADIIGSEDAERAGWRITGPEPTPEGGWQMTAVRRFAEPAELADALGSIGPPILDVRVGRETVDDETTTAITATLQLPNGFESFADDELLDAVGGLPWQERLAAAGATPESVMSLTIDLTLPGEITTTSGTEASPGTLRWEAPLDGSVATVEVVSVQRPSGASWWAGPLATIALGALIVWVLLGVVLAAAVGRARRRRARLRPRSRPAR